MSSNKITKKYLKWLEPLGLAFLLFAFGWQCLEERTAQIKTEGILYETNEKLLAIGSGIYDEALHSDRYSGDAVVFVNYDAFHDTMKDWGQIQYELNVVSKQETFFFRMRAVLFIVGSLLIIISKFPRNG